MSADRQKSEKEKMLAGEYYNASDAELAADRRRTRLLLHELNHSRDDETDRRMRILSELLPAAGPNLWIEPPFYCDYGWNIAMGERVYFNFNCVVLDVCPVKIGPRTLIASGVQILTATHPLDAAERSSGLEYGKPIAIGADVWIGAGALICPGVTIGDRAVIGAGAVVTRDIPADAVAYGNPARVRS